MTNDGLMVHVDCKRIKREELKLLPTPEPLSSRHKVIPHHHLDDVLRRVMAEYGFMIKSASYGVSGLDTKVPASKMFATYKLGHKDIEEKGRGLIFGLRTSNGGDLGAKGICGHNTFVCDNMAFSGEEVCFYGRHTTGLQLLPMIEEGVSKILARWADGERIEAMLQAKMLTQNEAKRTFWDMFEQDVIAGPMVRRAYQAYMEGSLPEIVDHQGTLSSLQQSCTRQLRDLPTRQKLERTIKLAKFIQGRIIDG